jgi:multidrug efflux pump subunit AcrB
MQDNMRHVPHGVTSWEVKSVSIDDVPIVTMTFYSPDGKCTPYELRRFAEEMKSRLDSLRNISLSGITGGYPREIMILPNIEKMASRNVSMSMLIDILKRNNQIRSVGTMTDGKNFLKILVGPALNSAIDVKNTVIKGNNNGLVLISDIAEVKDGPKEQKSYVSIGFGPNADNIPDNLKKKSIPAVTLSFSKKPGTNAVTVAKNIIEEANKLKKRILPKSCDFVITRNYGEIANNKVNNLISSMIFAIITVVALISFTMGWREGFVVGMSVPVSFALALFVNYISGYTINRVTLFALILSLGLVVDDPITNVDNIQRHIKMGIQIPFQATLSAVFEVIPPVIMSTLAIIVSFTPMFFITGMMGPYMGPMAINVPLTVTFSTLCALTFVPWLSYNLLKNKAGTGTPSNVTPEWVKKSYRMLISPFLNKTRAYILLIVVLFLTVLCSAIMLFFVPLKMLPFDNKDELQLILKMPEGTNLEDTARTVDELEEFLRTVNEVKCFESYVGSSAPIDFNGLVRHYEFRHNSNQADIRINLLKKVKRQQQSHTIGLRIRDDLTKIAEKHGGVLSVVEVPPGPPVLSTLTVEVYGRYNYAYQDVIKGAKELEEILKKTDAKHIVQVDDMSEAKHKRLLFEVNKSKAAVNGLSVNEIQNALSVALNGVIIGQAHLPTERNPLLIKLQLPYKDRVDTNRLLQLWIPAKTFPGKMVQLAELGKFKEEFEEQPIHHKNLKRVVYVTAECAGRAPGEIIMQILFNSWDKPFKSLVKSALSAKWMMNLSNGTFAEWGGEGEWEITVRVFRDLGIAFGVALLGIFLLLIIQTGSFVMPMVIMCSIPLTIIGIAPGFYLLNLFTGRTINGYADPVFFTATGMIGMIALGGIVIRNSIVLIEFIQEARNSGSSLKNAILQSGAVRFRPIILTALTTLMGAWPITLDPVFSGLAWALIFGLIASTFFTLIVIPTVYMLIYEKDDK